MQNNGPVAYDRYTDHGVAYDRCTCMTHIYRWGCTEKVRRSFVIPFTAFIASRMATTMRSILVAHMAIAIRTLCLAPCNSAGDQNANSTNELVSYRSVLDVCWNGS